MAQSQNLNPTDDQIMMPTTPFGGEMREKHFAFAKDYHPLNHGSFGTYPRSVMELQRRLQAETEARPDTFLRYTYPRLLKESRAAVASLLGSDVGEVVFIPNATTGVNTILRNLSFAGDDVILHFDTIYGACLKTVESIGESLPVQPRRIELAPSDAEADIREKLITCCRATQAEGKSVKLAMFDSVLTFPGMRFPWEILVTLCKEMGILSLVDGAHGIGHIDLTHLGAISPDFFVSNCYKWLMVPRGCAVLYVPYRNQHMIRTTLPTSWGYEAAQVRNNYDVNEYFVRLFEKISTTDNTPYLCVPKALEFRRTVCGGEANIRKYCQSVAAEGGSRLAESLGTEVMRIGSTGHIRDSCFTNVRLPLTLSEAGASAEEGSKVAKWMQERLPQEYQTYIPTKFYAGAFWSRLSGQIYLTAEDFAWAAGALKELCERAKRQEWKDGKA
ncbi:putative aminotransferase family protein [Xylariomycetidae sp. FL2044]|nr:putative aminotransferase family protein [Xylariomycetidae sp. FL2044]